MALVVAQINRERLFSFYGPSADQPNKELAELGNRAAWSAFASSARSLAVRVSSAAWPAARRQGRRFLACLPPASLTPSAARPLHSSLRSPRVWFARLLAVKLHPRPSMSAAQSVAGCPPNAVARRRPLPNG